MLSWQIHHHHHQHHQEQQHQQHQQHGGLTSVDVHAGKSTTGSQSRALETLALADGNTGSSQLADTCPVYLSPVAKAASDFQTGRPHFLAA